MKIKFIAFVFAGLLLMQIKNTRAQSALAVNAVLTADSMASGTYKDVLTSFFHLSLDNLTGAEKSVSYSFNVFALMLRQNHELNLDKNYDRYSAVRNTNVDFQLGIDENLKPNNFSAGVKYAFINQRDITVGNGFLKTYLASTTEYTLLNQRIAEKISTLSNVGEMVKLSDQVNNWFSNPDYIFSMLDPQLKTFIVDCFSSEGFTFLSKEKVTAPGYSYRSAVTAVFDSIKNSYQKKWLGTLSLNVNSFDHSSTLSNVNGSVELLKGLVDGSHKTNLELNFKLNGVLSDDTTTLNKSLGRQVVSYEGGVNFIVKGWGLNQSFLELKAAAADNIVLSKLYYGETMHQFTLNGTISIRVSENLRIPVEFKYDPVTQNVLGLLHVTSDFNWMKYFSGK